MQKDLSQVSDIVSFASIPAGEYLCRVSEVRRGAARDGSERWAVRLQVTAGEYAGRTAAWDGLTWSERGLPRVKFVLSRLGFETDGPVSIEPEDLVGRAVQATFVQEEWEDPLTARKVMRLRVPYAGYRRVNGTNGSTDPETPF